MIMRITIKRHFRLPNNSIIQKIEVSLEILLNFAGKFAEKLRGIGYALGLLLGFLWVF